MAKTGVCPNSVHKMGAEGVRIPTGDWLLKLLKNKSLPQMIKLTDKMLTESAKSVSLTRGVLTNKFGKIVVAIDKNNIPHYDKIPNMKYMVHSKYEYGTTLFQSFMTAKIVSGKMVMHIGIQLVTRGKFNPEFVRKTIQKCNKIRIGVQLFLLDREFYSTEVMRVVREFRKDFIMPAKKDGGIKRAIAEYVAGERKALSQYTISNGVLKFTFNLVIIKAPKKSKAKNMFDRYHVFATNISCRSAKNAIAYIPEEYRKRWGIETGYRSAKSIRPKTNSKDPVIRLLFYATSLILANIWFGLRKDTGRQVYNIILKVLLNQMINRFNRLYCERWPPPP